MKYVDALRLCCSEHCIRYKDLESNMGHLCVSCIGECVTKFIFAMLFCLFNDCECVETVEVGNIQQLHTNPAVNLMDCLLTFGRLFHFWDLIRVQLNNHSHSIGCHKGLERPRNT